MFAPSPSFSGYEKLRSEADLADVYSFVATEEKVKEEGSRFQVHQRRKASGRRQQSVCQGH